ncbi:MAG: extensin family protein [Hyphomicrobiales bacterium]
MAVDLAEIALADHRRVAVAHPADAAEALFLHTMRQAACGWFTTVLGPGSEATHAEHFHLDILRHGASDQYRICE